MNLKPLILATGIMLAANAAVAGGGTFSLNSTGYGSFGASVTEPGSFTEVWSFNLPTHAVDSVGSVFTFSGTGVGDVDFTSITLSGGGLAAPLAFTQLALDPAESWTLVVPQQLDPGNYALTLVGTKERRMRADYTGSFSVTAVPEPSAWVAALAGASVCFVLVALRRREPPEA